MGRGKGLRGRVVVPPDTVSSSFVVNSIGFSFERSILLLLLLPVHHRTGLTKTMVDR